MALPLEGCRIIDFTQVWAGPQGAGALADLGAEVLRVESLASNDVRRTNPVEYSPIRQLMESQWFYRNRQHFITVNVFKPEGVRLLKQLIPWGDVIILNLSPKTQRALGLDYPSLKAVKPELIVAAFSAAGQDGPFNDLIAFGPAMNVVVGSDGLMGYPEDEGRPMLHVWDPDPSMGIMLGFGIMTALFHRGRTGQGQLIDLPFSEILPNFLAEPIVDYQMSGVVPKPPGNTHPRMAPHENYPCSGNDSWVSIAVATDEEWRAMCRAIGQPELAADPKFSDAYYRLQHTEELDAIVGAWTRQRTHDEVTVTLQGVGVAAAPVFKVSELYHDAHDVYRRSLVRIEDPALPSENLALGIPWRLTETPGAVRRLGKPMGADNHEFYTEVIGMSEAEFERLVAEEIIY